MNWLWVIVCICYARHLHRAVIALLSNVRCPGRIADNTGRRDQDETSGCSTQGSDNLLRIARLCQENLAWGGLPGVLERCTRYKIQTLMTWSIISWRLTKKTHYVNTLLSLIGRKPRSAPTSDGALAIHGVEAPWCITRTTRIVYPKLS